MTNPMEPFRCRVKTGDGRRCQLFENHDDPHAFAWRVRTGPPRRGTYPLQSYLIRWRDDGLEPWHEQVGAERLRWCSMYTIDQERRTSSRTTFASTGDLTTVTPPSPLGAITQTGGRRKAHVDLRVGERGSD